MTTNRERYRKERRAKALHFRNLRDFAIAEAREKYAMGNDYGEEVSAAVARARKYNWRAIHYHCAAEYASQFMIR